MIKHTLLLVILGVWPAALLLGCNTSTGPAVEQVHASTPRSQARFVGKPTLKLIVPGETTQEWVHTMLGEPSSTDDVSNAQRKIIRYEYESVRNGKTTAYRILEPSERRGRIAHAIHFEIANGVVLRWWIE